jgi:hypothetical protein
MNKTISHRYSRTTSADGCILVAFFSRPFKVAECINSLELVKKNSGVDIVAIYQRNDPAIHRILLEKRNLFKTLIDTEPLGNSPITNINKNRILGYEYCFNELGKKWVLAIEEDTKLAHDSVNFTNFLINSYASKRDFRCINLGSRNYQLGVNPNSFSIFRYGMLGQGSVITRRTWDQIKRIHRHRLSAHDGFDGIVENYLKTGFSVWPNTSRIYDTGWDGTHGGGDPTEAYFIEQERSWELTAISKSGDYRFIQTESFWRLDRIKYKRSMNLFYWFKHYVLPFKKSISTHRKNLLRKFSESFQLH